MTNLRELHAGPYRLCPIKQRKGEIIHVFSPAARQAYQVWREGERERNDATDFARNVPLFSCNMQIGSIKTPPPMMQERETSAGRTESLVLTILVSGIGTDFSVNLNYHIPVNKYLHTILFYNLGSPEGHFILHVAISLRLERVSFSESKTMTRKKYN